MSEEEKNQEMLEMIEKYRKAKEVENPQENTTITNTILDRKLRKLSGFQIQEIGNYQESEIHIKITGEFKRWDLLDKKLKSINSSYGEHKVYLNLKNMTNKELMYRFNDLYCIKELHFGKELKVIPDNSLNSLLNCECLTVYPTTKIGRNCEILLGISAKREQMIKEEIKNRPAKTEKKKQSPNNDSVWIPPVIMD